MIAAVVDTNILIEIYRNNTAAKAWFGAQQDSAITSITWFELIEGARGKAGQAACLQIISTLTLLDLTEMDQFWAREQLLRFRLSHGITVPHRKAAAFMPGDVRRSCIIERTRLYCWYRSMAVSVERSGSDGSLWVNVGVLKPCVPQKPSDLSVGSVTDCLIASVAHRLRVPVFTQNIKDFTPILGANLVVKPY